MFVAERGPTLLGFGQATPGAVTAIYVAPECSGTGVGSVLLRHALAAARAGSSGSIRLTATRNAVGFYERFGFAVVEERSIEKGDIALEVSVMELGGGA
jgi:ribosomal protein S18 acetylase RimI-like enzyme